MREEGERGKGEREDKEGVLQLLEEASQPPVQSGSVEGYFK